MKRFADLLRSVALYCALALGCQPLFALAETGQPSDLDLARRLENAFVQVADQASRSVVVVSTTRKIDLRSAFHDSDEDGDDDGHPPIHPFPQQDEEVPEHPDVDAQGSGTVIRADGYILTNHHVIDGSSDIRVRFRDGTEHEARVIGVDGRTDVAVIKIDATDLVPARLASSDKVRVGQWAIAIGAPFQLDYSFTVGFVSATGRSDIGFFGSSAYRDYIQTDAAINPGNSGGPLCDIEGRVIGINTLIRGLNRGIGFAIPINMAMEIANQLIDGGRVVRPWIGIGIEPLSADSELREMVGDLKEGVVVSVIYPDTPASRSSLEPADVIVAVDGVAVGEPSDLQRQILAKAIGQEVLLNVVRGKQTVQVALTTGELPDRPQWAAYQPRPVPKPGNAWGLVVEELPADSAGEPNRSQAGGVVVSQVAAGKIAAREGLEPGDVIFRINHVAVTNVSEFNKQLQNGNAAEGVLVQYRRNGLSSFVILKD